MISERLFERSSPSLAHWSDALTVFFSEILLYETVTGGTQLWLSLNLKSCSSYHTRTNKHIRPECIILQCIIKTAPETSQSRQTTKHLAFNVIMDISKWKSTDSSHAFAFVSTNVCNSDVKQNGFSFIKVVFFRSIHILTAHHRLT